MIWNGPSLLPESHEREEGPKAKDELIGNWLMLIFVSTFTGSSHVWFHQALWQRTWAVNQADWMKTPSLANRNQCVSYFIIIIIAIIIMLVIYTNTFQKSSFTTINRDYHFCWRSQPYSSADQQPWVLETANQGGRKLSFLCLGSVEDDTIPDHLALDARYK